MRRLSSVQVYPGQSNGEGLERTLPVYLAKVLTLRHQFLGRDERC